MNHGCLQVPRAVSRGSRLVATVFVVLVFGVFASVAAADSGTSASDQYDSTKVIKPAPVTKPATVVKGVSTTVSKTTTPAAPAATKGTLPFTGLSLLTVVVVGGALVVVGFGLRRRGRGEH